MRINIESDFDRTKKVRCAIALSPIGRVSGSGCLEAGVECVGYAPTPCSGSTVENKDVFLAGLPDVNLAPNEPDSEA